MTHIDKKVISQNGINFEFAVRGTKSPAIILINGAGGPIEGWFKLWGQLGCDNVVFAYNRLGIGKSSKPKAPQSGRTMVRDLKELLVTLKIDPPYLLVGHSLGGLVAHLFALTYPERVIGVVFLESSTIQDVLQGNSKAKVVKQNDFSEVSHVLSTVKQIQESGSFPNIPITVIAGNKPAFAWIMPRAIKEARLKNQIELSHLSGRGRVAIASKSGHFPQLTEPSVVIYEINRLLHEMTTCN